VYVREKVNRKEHTDKKSLYAPAVILNKYSSSLFSITSRLKYDSITLFNLFLNNFTRISKIPHLKNTLKNE
jgi:hypothetical protein